MKLKDP